MNFIFSKLYLPVLVIVLLQVTTLFSNAESPHWRNGTPYSDNGASTIDISVALDQSGKVYYVVFSKDPGNIEPEELKDLALNNDWSNVAAKGELDVQNPDETREINIAKLPDNHSYYTLLVAENERSELQNELKQVYNKTFVRHSKNTCPSKVIPGIIGYYAYFPEEYYKSPFQNFPLLIYLHGIGEKANSTTEPNWPNICKYGPPMLIEQGVDYPFIVISPQTPYEWWQGEYDGKKRGDLVDEVIETVKKLYNIDPSRVYVTGISMGGAGVYAYYESYPEKLAAAIPVSGYTQQDLDEYCHLKDVPLWALHNEFDDVIGTGSDRGINQIINSCEPPPQTPAKLTLYPAYGHDAWSRTYENMEPGSEDNIYEWMLKCVNGNLPEDGSNKTPYVFGGENQVVSVGSENITLEARAFDLDGRIDSYQWRQIEGPRVNLEGDNSESLEIYDLQEGKYKFRITVKDNGGRTSFDEVWLEVSDVLLGTEDHQFRKNISLSPNPVENVITVTANKGFSSIQNITVCDLSGLEIAALKSSTLSGNQLSIDLSNASLPSGLYLLKISEDGLVTTSKFVKQ